MTKNINIAFELKEFEEIVAVKQIMQKSWHDMFIELIKYYNDEDKVIIERNKMIEKLQNDIKDRDMIINTMQKGWTK